ncbi:hypothetical protein DUT90_00335 [Polaribacter sp. WD7]|uniref:DUF6168 family protein n=1 Tax=Polaribacter sp. WD7 TaxID=2269061 RepID=UPI000DF16708|nr:DUF6168 family protein [Polaribacter sp. WD7]RCS28473.1 hypothetical protein DUT90_00335 [Polaribacter sp. WD7]
MIKSIIFYTIVFFLLFLVSNTLHQFYIESKAIQLPFSLQKVYTFHLGFSLLVCLNIALLSNVDKFTEQLGFVYLVTIFLKLILFSVIFYKSIFTEESLSTIARISLFVPSIIFLLTEAIFIAKILNKKQ